MKKYSLIIHGGCGAVHLFTPKEKAAYLKSMEKIVTKGEAMLAAGKSALDTVEECVKLLENDPIFNAGKGSVLNEQGKVEMDASIMDGRTLSAGAVAGVSTVKNPVQLARKVMENTSHVFLISQGAEKFAKISKAIQKPNSYFIIKKRIEQWKAAKKSNQVKLDHDSQESKELKKGTVGAVAFDQHGNLAAATSTGGMTFKKFGRTGDSPIIGAGNYADNLTCAVSCTGRGEDFIKTGMAKFISDLIYLKKYSAEKAARVALKYFRERVNGYGGFILIDRKGDIASAYTTEGLIRGYVSQGKPPVCKLFE